MCERELETEQNCNILTPTLLAITAFLSRSPGLLNWGPRGPASLGHVPQSSIFSPTGLISKLSIGNPEASSAGGWLSVPHLVSNWSGLQTNWLPVFTELYNSSTPTFLWRSQSHSLYLSMVKVIFWYSLSRWTCYLHRCIFYFDSPAGL